MFTSFFMDLCQSVKAYRNPYRKCATKNGQTISLVWPLYDSLDFYKALTRMLRKNTSEPCPKKPICPDLRARPG